MRGSNETYGLQNRTYIVTTILVSLCKVERVGWGEKRKGNIFHLSFMIEFLKVETPERIQQTSVIISRSLPNSILRTSVRQTEACLESETLRLASAIHVTSFCLGDARLQDRWVLLYEFPKYVWKIAQGAMRHKESDVWSVCFSTRWLPLKTNLEEEKKIVKVPKMYLNVSWLSGAGAPPRTTPFIYFFQLCPSKIPSLPLIAIVIRHHTALENTHFWGCVVSACPSFLCTLMFFIWLRRYHRVFDATRPGCCERPGLHNTDRAL